MVLVLLAIAIAVAALIGRQFADDPEEENLLWKLAGYAALGFFTFNINRLPLPLGFAIAWLISSRAERNQGARRAAAIATFVLWLLGLFVF